MNASILLPLKSLMGFRLIEAYSAALGEGEFDGLLDQGHHDFPAVTIQDDQPFACATEEGIVRVIRLLPYYRFQLDKSMYLLCPDGQYGFSLAGLEYASFGLRLEDMKPIRILSDADVYSMDSPRFFGWQSLPDPLYPRISRELFEELLEEAITDI